MATIVARTVSSCCTLAPFITPAARSLGLRLRSTGDLILVRGKQTATNIRIQPKLGHTKATGFSGGISYKRAIERREQSADDAAKTVIAYNLSDELKIDNVHRLLETLDEYRINQSLPEDIQDDAVLLSSSIAANDLASGDYQDPDLAAKRLNDIFLFREGSIVFWGVPYNKQQRILYGLSSLKVNPNTSDYIQEEREYMTYELNDEIDKSRLTRDTIQIATRNQDERSMKLDQFAFSHAVALSVKLGIWEMTLDEYIESVEWITENMKEGKNIKLTRDQVFKKTGEILCLKHSINLSSDLLDLPDVYWDRSDQENMFSSLSSYLNIRKRTNVMNEKLNNCCELMTLLAGHMNDRHHIRLEWMIIVLITVEVLFEVARFL